MTIALSPTQASIEEALCAFVTSVVPAGTQVVMGQVNRVPEPTGTDYVLLNWVMQPRLATNVESFTDVTAQASAVGAVLTVVSVQGTLVAGLPVLGGSVAAGTTLGTQLTGTPGGAGTYALSPSQTFDQQAVSMGTRTVNQRVESVLQCDVHGDLSRDNSSAITTLWRDDYAVPFLAPLGGAPLYCGEPRQVGFDNGEQQWEDLWSSDLHLEINQLVLNLPQQFAAQLDASLYDVQAEYPN